MTCKYNYRSISLRNKTHSKLENLSNIVVKGEKLSIPKTVEKLICLIFKQNLLKKDAFKIFWNSLLYKVVKAFKIDFLVYSFLRENGCHLFRSLKN